MPPPVLQAVNYMGVLPSREIPNVTLELGPNLAGAPRLSMHNEQHVLFEESEYSFQMQQFRATFKN